MVENVMHATFEHSVRPVDDPSDGKPILTVIVPACNEEGTISELLARVVAAPYSKQVIVVDDGSTDGTADVLRTWQDDTQIEILRHDFNRGVGAAIRTALPNARGRFTIVQDADLEYDPQDYPRFIEPLLAGKARAVFGSRYMPESPPDPLWRRVVMAARMTYTGARNAIASFILQVIEFPYRCAAMVLRAFRRATDEDISPARVAGR